MYSSLQLTTNYLRYYRKASNGKGHGMHSPFVFDFIRHVLNNKLHYLPPPEIEERRNIMLRDKRIIEIMELGAGSRKNNNSYKSVSEIARSALKSKKYAQLLYRLTSHYRPGYIIELGTSLGITTAYLAAAARGSKLVTIEGNPQVQGIALENLNALAYPNVESIVGDFDHVLPRVLENFPRIDLAYVDGNHRYAPTINYFKQLVEKANPDSIFVFDDIHWSPEMEQAWLEIREHPSVRYTIDIFFLGFVFFKKEFKVKQDFVIRF